MAKRFKNYQEAIDWLFYELPRTSEKIFRGESGLQRMQYVQEAFGSPQNNYKTVHIAGTSGKGTIAMLITNNLRHCRKKVGTIMSPHVYDIRERFLVDGGVVSKSIVLKAMERVYKIIRELNEDEIFPSYYETALLLSYVVFDQFKLDYLVVETGFGGLLDGTNLIYRKDKLVVLAQIGLDHTEVLGNTVEKIAAQKAGIIYQGNHVLALDQAAGVNRIFTEVARQKKAEIDFVKPVKPFARKQSLAGAHQLKNIALSREAINYLAKRDNWHIPDGAISRAEQEFALPGRFELIKQGGKRIILDGAHNEQKIAALIKTIQKCYPGEKFGVVFGTSKTRDSNELIELIKPIAIEFVFTKYSALKSDMKRAARDFTGIEHEGINSRVINNPEEVVRAALASASMNWLVTGSFFVVSEVGEKLHKL